jgi:multicomponent K+:H+ antiporter subunit F
MSPFLAHATYFAIGCFVTAMTLSLWRLFRGPTAQDRVLALDFLYVNGLLIVLVVGIRYASQTYFDAALLMASFGFLGSTALAKFLLRGEAIE